MRLSIDLTTEELSEIVRTVTMTGKFSVLQDISDTLQHIENVNRQSLRQQRRTANASVRTARNVASSSEEYEDDLPVVEFDDGL